MLQPRHLEKEFRGGQLHLYTSVFGGGLILRGVELPEALETMDKSPVQVDPLNELPVDFESQEELLEDEEAQEDLPEDEEVQEDLPKDEKAQEDLPEDEEAQQPGTFYRQDKYVLYILCNVQ
jgi:hypothetical protein